MATIGKHGKVIYSEEDIQFIKDNFFQMTNDQLAIKLGVSKFTLRLRLNELGIYKIKYDYWSKEAVEYLKANYKTMGNVEIIEYFSIHFPKAKGWHKRHIQLKLEQLGLRRNYQDLWIIMERNMQKGSYGELKPDRNRMPMPKIYVMVDAKTRIEVKPGSNINELKQKYEQRNDHQKK
ncbi:hypothetical protein [Flavobacterium geliluteum]|uniref:Uncharacterized protein n=1 Tax=Flavobacterium geliluteum TaxID=2816120 RepID=A0A941AXW3_9FLAO|nr:hypothetical protein [Flavobacterium geliluteum]MBP4139645.1 hypothetical protein [Flavobacterium geliluteum]